MMILDFNYTTRCVRWVLSTVLVMLLATAARADYRAHPEAVAFIDELVSDHGFARDQLEQWLSHAQRQQNILDAIARPSERVRSWKEYRPIFVVPLRVNNGVAFWQEHQEALARAEQKYGVPAEVVVAIIGVETNYGRNMGSHRVIDALATLAFDYPPRAPFFCSALKNYLLLSREHEQNPLDFKGSYAGDMGYCQFLACSYFYYAVDFHVDGFLALFCRLVMLITWSVSMVLVLRIFWRSASTRWGSWPLLFGLGAGDPVCRYCLEPAMGIPRK